MRTTGCLDRNRRETERAVSHQCKGHLLFALQAIHLADKHEYHKGDNQEIEQCVEEDAVIDRSRTRSFCFGEGGRRWSGMDRKGHVQQYRQSLKWGEATQSEGRPQARQLLRDRTSDRGKNVVGISANQPDRANHDYQNHGQHHRVFSDVLTFLLRPQFAKPPSHLFLH